MNHTRNSGSFEDSRKDPVVLDNSLKTLTDFLNSCSKTDEKSLVFNDVESAKNLVLEHISERFRSSDKSLGYWEMPANIAKVLIPLMIEKLDSSTLLNLLQLNECDSVHELLAKL